MAKVLIQNIKNGGIPERLNQHKFLPKFWSINLFLISLKETPVINIMVNIEYIIQYIKNNPLLLKIHKTIQILWIKEEKIIVIIITLLFIIITLPKIIKETNLLKENIPLNFIKKNKGINLCKVLIKIRTLHLTKKRYSEISTVKRR